MTYQPVQPERPRGVRVQHVDGTVTPIELTYRGILNSQYVWQAMTPLSPADRVLFESIPLDTAIEFPRAPGWNPTGTAQEPNRSAATR